MKYFIKYATKRTMVITRFHSLFILASDKNRKVGGYAEFICNEI